MLEQVTAALTALQAEGSFAGEQACPSDDLHIVVDDVGPIEFPISAATARKLCAVAQPAPFGRRAETLYDRRVRDTWEIGKRRVKIDARAWKHTLDPQLTILRDRLGMQKTDKLRAVFDKMLIYAPGQFFAVHQDSERADDMVGTLVVTLPSRHAGGAILVEHRGQKKVLGEVERGRRDLSLVAFYADCHHEVEPVQSGYRIALTYHLHCRRHAGTGSPQDFTGGIDRLADRVKAYFASPMAAKYSTSPPERPERLIYLLDHEYTQKSLGWDRLKNADRLRVGALRQVAERLDCEVYLALADVHESWSCEGDDREYGYGRRGRHSYRYDEEEEEDDDDGDGEDYELTELFETDVELRHWIGPEGHAAPSVSAGASSDEICFTLASVEMDPFKSEHEGNMGNYGNTVDRWYHRAALVMWPRARNFVIRAKVSPSWACKEIEKSLAAGDTDDAGKKARSLLPFWHQSAPQEKHAAFFRKLCVVLRSLDDADLAQTLLSPFEPGRLVPSATPAFVALVEQYGLSFAQSVLLAWSKHKHWGMPPWLTSLPRLCQAFAESAGEHGGALAVWFLEHALASFKERHAGRLRSGPSPDSAVQERNSEILYLLDAARLIQAASIHDALIAFLTAPKTALPIMEAGALLQSCEEGRTPAEVRALGLHGIHRHVGDALEKALAAPVRRRDDWSIEPPTECACPLCKELAVFLRAGDQIEYAWPLAKERRRHIHGIIDTHGLPLAHTTIRSGSPQTLLLRKQDTLFKQAAALRAQQKALLSWLKKRRAWFAGHS